MSYNFIFVLIKNFLLILYFSISQFALNSRGCESCIIFRGVFNSFMTEVLICGALRDLVPFVQFRKREKHPWKSVNLSKLQAEACNFTKIDTPPCVFFTFFKIVQMSTKSRNASHIPLSYCVTIKFVIF